MKVPSMISSSSISFAWLCLSLSLSLSLSSNSILSHAASTTTTPEEKHIGPLIEWLESSKGFISPSVEMRRTDPNDPSSRFGMFARHNIPAGKLLLEIPPSVILDSGPDAEITAMVCPLVRNLIKEIHLKNESSYAPFTNYLLDTQPPGINPSAWTIPARELFMKILGHDDFSYSKAMKRYSTTHNLELRNTLPPMDPIGWIEHEWYNDCDGSNDPTEEYAALIVVSRGWDDLLIPFYDMINHRNGNWLNTYSHSDGDKGVHSSDKHPVKVSAKRSINKGEEIYSSYNMCEDCGARLTKYGTPEILRDYGFVEQMPQTWIFDDVDLGWRIDEEDPDDLSDEKRYVLVEWIDGEEPDEHDIELLKEKLDTVQENKLLIQNNQRKKHSKITNDEWETMQEFMDAMELGIIVAIDWYDQLHQQDTCIEDGSCTVSLDRYRDLDTTYHTTNAEYYSSLTCDIQTQFQIFDDGTFKLIDEFKSQYQQINFLMNHDDLDTCMDLDDTIQICDAYRPHYHEYAVHQTARFLPPHSIRRVLFVGGGDSMLLHEIMKYPSLELVVGLELDQKVTRGCFKHFGTQPHFDDDRVEWWFGDASKSLLMLPESYFGSFDLVLVDLSETVMSFKVTDKLDVLEALTLLVKPEGIFVKNEVYFDKFRTMFPYSAQVNWYDNPIICSQVMVMGSRTVDFMRPTLTNHQTNNLVVKELEDITDNFELYHDYSHNKTSHHLCDSEEARKKDMTKQTRSPGIIFVVEAEDVSMDLSDADAVKLAIANAMQKEGLTVIDSDVSKSQEQEGTSTRTLNSIITVVLEEGYIVARAMAEKKYVGLDIHFWSSLDKHEAAKDAAIAAVGYQKGSPLSTYRVIAGGMFGMDTWKEEEMNRGPQFDELCKTIKGDASSSSRREEVKERHGDVKQDDVNTAIEKGLAFIGRGGLRIALLVGNEDSTKKIADGNIAILQSFEDMVDEVITFNCPSMANFNEFSEEAGDALTGCERDLLQEFTNLASEAKFDALIIDASADKFTSTILLKALSARRVSLVESEQGAVFEKDAIVLSVRVHNDSDDAWRRNLVLLFKDDVFVDSPSAFTEISFEDDENDSAFSLLVTNNGGEHFIQNLNSTIIEFENDASNTLKTDIKVINGGQWLFQEDFEPSRIFLPGDYDQSSPLQQWKSQEPVGHQFILQMEPGDKRRPRLSSELVKKAMENAVFKSDLPGIDKASVKDYKSIGDGCVVVSTWSSGSVIALWDGRTHVDVNLFTYVEEIEIGNDFEASFLEILPNMATMLRDEQPRGVGRVISYQRDLQDEDVPHWA